MYPHPGSTSPCVPLLPESIPNPETKNIENNTNKNNFSNPQSDVLILFDVIFILIQLSIIPVMT